MRFIKEHLFLLTIILDCFFILVAVSIGALKLSKNAFVEIFVIPKDAKLTIDGKVYENGTINFYPGVHHFKLEKEGLETKEEDIDLTSGHTTFYNEYLVGENGDLSYYLTHPEDYSLLKIYAENSETEDFIKNEDELESIIFDLPFFYYQSGMSRYDDIAFEVYFGGPSECNGKNFCLTVEGSSMSTKDQILNTIRENGYEPERYEIYFNGEKL